MRFIELFAGIGGFRYGLEKASVGKDCATRGHSSDTEFRWKGTSERGKFLCVWANELDKYACQISRKNYPDETLIEGDIRTVDPLTIPEHDLLCAGFPCQSFSIAGKRGGFEDTRGTLFFEIMRIAGAKRTPYLLLENVKGLLSHDEGDTFQTILRTLDEFGYDCQWQVLNSKNFGVPQNRERVFIIGHLRGQPRPKVFPIGEELQEANPEEYERGISGTLSVKNQSGQANWDGSTTLIHTAYPNEVREYKDTSPTVSTPSGGGHLPMVVIGGNNGKLDDRTLESAKGFQENGDMPSMQSREEDRVPPQERGLARPQSREYSGDMQGLPYQATPNSSKENSLSQEGKKFARSIRRLTPRECERLQGFPDNWTEGISDTQRYKCLGNAVTVNVIEAIGRQLLVEV